MTSKTGPLRPQNGTQKGGQKPPQNWSKKASQKASKNIVKNAIKRWVCGRVFFRSPARICCNVHRFLHFLTSPKSRLWGPKVVPKMDLKMGAQEVPQGTQNGPQNDPKTGEKKSCERWQGWARLKRLSQAWSG